MGTQASLMMASDADIDEAARIAADVLEALEARFTSYRRDSEFSRFARGTSQPPSDDLRHVLAACAWLEDVSDGHFTMYPNGVDAPPDVAGYVKGWAVDRAVDGLLAAGITDAALGVGGDWRGIGRRGDGLPWRIGVLDPHRRQASRALVSLSDSALATSGTYERGDHLRHRNGAQAAASCASFTVHGPRLAWADAFATAGYLMGEAGLAWVAGFPGYSAALVRDDGTMVADDDFPLAVSEAALWWPRLRAPYAAA
jgi:thiamine biosynthesis lipoprotein